VKACVAVVRPELILILLQIFENFWTRCDYIIIDALPCHGGAGRVGDRAADRPQSQLRIGTATSARLYGNI
tara:strand:- start:280 stop:492 length:213 start_codon:yes stop_codon:yes gene_type:complete